MKKFVSVFASILFASATGAAFAGDTPGQDPMHHGGKSHMMGPRDCATVPAEHKERCEARQKAMAERMTKPHDCSKAPDDMKERCEARNKAVETCKDKAPGKDHQACMMEQRPKK